MVVRFLEWRVRLAQGLLIGAGLVSVACDSRCDDGDRTYEDGAHWTCSDGCNGCSCDSGEVTSTLIGCPEPPGEGAGKLSCNVEGVWVPHGQSFSCGDACCTCEDGEAVEADESC